MLRSVLRNPNLAKARLQFALRRSFAGVATNKLHELRVYTLKPEAVPAYMALTAGEGFKARTDASKLLGFFATEIGSLNSVIHFWEYDDLAHRTAVRAKLAGDKGFGEYVGAARPMWMTQTSSLVRPVALSPLMGDCQTEDKGGGIYVLEEGRMVQDLNVSATAQRVVDKHAEVMGVWRSETQPGAGVVLYRCDSFQAFSEWFYCGEGLGVSAGIISTSSPSKVSLMSPTSWSPMK